jgi:hypothetical protein
MKRISLTGLVALLALASVAPAAADAATRLRQVQVGLGSTPMSPPTGTLTLRFVFKNTSRHRNKFTPRRLTRIDFSNVPLQCMNSAGTGSTELSFTRTLDVAVKVMKTPQPAGKKPKPGRYAFRFSYTFTDFSGSVRGTIDKSNRAKKPRAPRSQGTLSIADLDADADHRNCNSDGLRQWGGLPLTGVPAS